MNVEIHKSDISEILWLQRAIEDVLINETLKRSIKIGVNDPNTKYLFREKVDYEFGIITISYESGKLDSRFSEEYTLKEALSLCSI